MIWSQQPGEDKFRDFYDTHTHNTRSGLFYSQKQWGDVWQAHAGQEAKNNGTDKNSRWHRQEHSIRQVAWRDEHTLVKLNNRDHYFYNIQVIVRGKYTCKSATRVLSTGGGGVGGGGGGAGGKVPPQTLQLPPQNFCQFKFK